MRSIVKTVTAVGPTAAIPVDTYITPMQVSAAVVMVGSTYAECTIQHTFDNVFDSSITPTWWDTTTDASEKENEGYLLQEDGGKILQETGYGLLIGDEDIQAHIDFPVSAVRLNITDISAGGSVTFTVLQSGRPG